MMKKIKIALFLAVILILAAGGYLYFWKAWWPVKQLKIQQGLAHSNFPWANYTQEQLNEMYPQIKYANVPTRVTPEETYANFREALRTNNLEMALEQLAVENKNYNNNKVSIETAYKENNFVTIYKAYPEKIEKSYFYESIAQYYFTEELNNKTTNYPINFVKNKNGDWKMDSL
jgi:hypothetical protein